MQGSDAHHPPSRKARGNSSLTSRTSTRPRTSWRLRASWTSQCLYPSLRSTIPHKLSMKSPPTTPLSRHLMSSKFCSLWALARRVYLKCYFLTLTYPFSALLRPREPGGKLEITDTKCNHTNLSRSRQNYCLPATTVQLPTKSDSSSKQYRATRSYFSRLHW